MNDSRPSISVILPFYHSEKTLGRAINSILEQTFRNFELILVDNDSSDQSRAIALAFCGRDKRCRLLTEKRPGVSHAMNAGMRAAAAPFLARMDADDVSAPRRLERQLDCLNSNPDTGLVGGKAKHIGHHEQTAGFKSFVDWVNSFHRSDEIDLYRFIEMPIVNPTVMFRAGLPRLYGGYREGDFPEDYELLLRWLDAGVKMTKLDEFVLDWHDSESRLSRTDKRYLAEAFYRTKSRYLARWLKRNNPFHPGVMIWGAGRRSRRRAGLLEEWGIRIEGYIDIVEDKLDGRCLHYSKISPPGEYFILSYVGTRGARERISEFLTTKGYREGLDFLMVA